MNDTKVEINMFCSFTLQSYFIRFEYCTVYFQSYCIFSLKMLLFLSFGFNRQFSVQLSHFHDDYETFPSIFWSLLFNFRQTRTHFGFRTIVILVTTEAKPHHGRHLLLLSKPGKLLWFSRQHRVGNDVLSGAPPLEWLRAMFVAVV